MIYICIQKLIVVNLEFSSDDYCLIYHFDNDTWCVCGKINKFILMLLFNFIWFTANVVSKFAGNEGFTTNLPD